MSQIIIKFTSTRPSTSVDFYKDVDLINYVLNSYIVSQRLRAVTTRSDDGLVQTTILTFATLNDLLEIQSDAVMKEHNRKRSEYNNMHNIVYSSEKIS